MPFGRQPVQEAPSQEVADLEIKKAVEGQAVEQPKKDYYRVISAEALPDGTFIHIVSSNKLLGEVGATYDAD